MLKNTMKTGGIALICAALLLACSSTGRSHVYADAQEKPVALSSALFFFADTGNIDERASFENHFVQGAKAGSFEVIATHKRIPMTEEVTADRLLDYSQSGACKSIIVGSVPSRTMESTGDLKTDWTSGLISVNERIRNQGNILFLIYDGHTGQLQSKTLVTLSKGGYRKVVPAAIDRYLEDLRKKGSIR